uniref:CDC42 small effector 1 n=1 Tax=Hippocampus comes TaxID=109280 RepID=A0A3Q2Z5T5_HIPCM
MSEFWHKMACCVTAKAPPKRRRRRIDRSMIGEPTNFIHLTHIGSGEMADGRQPVRTGGRQTHNRSPIVVSRARVCVCVCVCAVGVRSGADEVEMSKHERQKQPFVAGVPRR